MISKRRKPPSHDSRAASVPVSIEMWHSSTTTHREGGPGEKDELDEGGTSLSKPWHTHHAAKKGKMSEKWRIADLVEELSFAIVFRAATSWRYDSSVCWFLIAITHQL